MDLNKKKFKVNSIFLIYLVWVSDTNSMARVVISTMNVIHTCYCCFDYHQATFVLFSSCLLAPNLPHAIINNRSDKSILQLTKYYYIVI